MLQVGFSAAFGNWLHNIKLVVNRWPIHTEVILLHLYIAFVIAKINDFVTTQWKADKFIMLWKRKFLYVKASDGKIQLPYFLIFNSSLEKNCNIYCIYVYISTCHDLIELFYAMYLLLLFNLTSTFK